MVEIFKTDVREVSHAERIVMKLCEHFPHARINFDLNDCDKILRVENNDTPIDVSSVMQIVRQCSSHISLIAD